MAVIEKNSAPFRPYARLMTMLGDQLITDKKVAIIELIKNCYDADAKHVSVRFGNISNISFNDLPQEDLSFIEIEDDGDGMTLDIIKNVWLRPATPNKLKSKTLKQTTKLGRIIQGEKGIGRFAIHKLGTKIELYTKSENSYEVRLDMNFSDYDPEQSNLFNQESQEKLLEDVKNTWYVNNPPEQIKEIKGTKLIIYCLREKWIKKDFDELYRNIQRLIPPIDPNATNFGIIPIKDFVVELIVENKKYANEEATSFRDVIERAQFKMSGKVDENGNIEFVYKSSAPYREISYAVNLLDSDEMARLNYKNLYGIRMLKERLNENESLNCGPFFFSYYAFDLAKPDKTLLNQDLKNFIKDNFVYVLRDGVRVYPYGEKGNDWLNLDKLRSTQKAGAFISYNDLTGFIYISQNGNPNLKDSTNRQGMMDIDGALDEFTNLVTATTEIFNLEIKLDKERKNLNSKENFHKVASKLENDYKQFKSALEKIQDQNCLVKANKFIDTYQKHLKLIEGRMETVEDLAGLGMAVEKSSHDSLRLLALMKKNIKDYVKKASKYKSEQDELVIFLEELSESISIVYDDLQLIQPLFKIQRSTIKDISLVESIEKVKRYFRSDITGKIDVEIDDKQGDILVRTNAGLILQVLINLVDNSIYWVNSIDNFNKEIKFKLNSQSSSLIIADNGPGVRPDIAPLIFQEFVSMKSNGRGLGLYIVRELLLRINATIDLIEDNSRKILSGANFEIKFNSNNQ